MPSEQAVAALEFAVSLGLGLVLYLWPKAKTPAVLGLGACGWLATFSFLALVLPTSGSMFRALAGVAVAFVLFLWVSRRTLTSSQTNDELRRDVSMLARDLRDLARKQARESANLQHVKMEEMRLNQAERPDVDQQRLAAIWQKYTNQERELQQGHQSEEGPLRAKAVNVYNEILTRLPLEHQVTRRLADRTAKSVLEGAAAGCPPEIADPLHTPSPFLPPCPTPAA